MRSRPAGQQDGGGHALPRGALPGGQGHVHMYVCMYMYIYIYIYI